MSQPATPSNGQGIGLVRRDVTLPDGRVVRLYEPVHRPPRR